jgi:hypothetical protein
VAYNFQIGENKIKLLKEYENVAQRVLLFIGHENSGNNLE